MMLEMDVPGRGCESLVWEPKFVLVHLLHSHESSSGRGHRMCLAEGTGRPEAEKARGWLQ